LFFSFLFKGSKQNAAGFELASGSAFRQQLRQVFFANFSCG
jgi:hypothetical protein